MEEVCDKISISQTVFSKLRTCKAFTSTRCFTRTTPCFLFILIYCFIQGIESTRDSKTYNFISAMSTLKRGRKRKGGGGNNNDNAVDFDVDKFRMHTSNTLVLFPNSDVPKWSLTQEWVEFAKIDFLYYIRSSYQFFKNNRASVFH